MKEMYRTNVNPINVKREATQNVLSKTSVKVVQDTDSFGLTMKRWYLSEQSGVEKSTTCSLQANIIKEYGEYVTFEKLFDKKKIEKVT